jgi:hypothetical protein
MKIGFANIYSFRPHVEHLYYLSRLARGGGHATSFLSCDASVDWCYAQGLKGTPRWKECPQCVVGGVRSYLVGPVHSISGFAVPANLRAPERLTLSSACTLLRTETDADQQSVEVLATRERLSEPVRKVYGATLAWIERDHLDAVICFNGRMELTQAVIQACRDAGIPFLTHERTWFGDGLLLTPNDNCLGLGETHRMAQIYRELPLKLSQARLAAALVAKRFSRQNDLEWRIYNRNAQSATWPSTGEGERYLVLPSSRNEFVGHPDWQSDWSNYTEALDDLMAAQNLQPNQLVVRCHPNWAESIGRATGQRSFEVYREWCQRRGVVCIGPADTASTHDLIAQTDVVVLNGGSAAIEAGALGKRVLSLGPANYARAGIAAVVNGPQDLRSGVPWPELSPRELMRLTLRFIYMSARRLPQFNDYVQPQTTTRYRYFDGADPRRLEHALREGQLLADDDAFANDQLAENAVLDAMEDQAWRELATHPRAQTALRPCNIQRRAAFRWVDGVRGLFKHGDR